MNTARRSSRRRWPRVVAALVSVVLAAVGVKAITMVWFSAAGANDFSAGRFDSSAEQFTRLRTVNVIDPALALVGLGDARYRVGDLLAAENSFAEALGHSPDDCEIRFNLAVTIEAQGDRILAGEPLGPDDQNDAPDRTTRRELKARERYAAAQAVAEADDCPSARADDPGDRLDATLTRLKAKIRALSEEDDTEIEADEPVDDPNDRGDAEEIRDLDQRNQTGAVQREASRDRDASGRNPDAEADW